MYHYVSHDVSAFTSAAAGICSHILAVNHRVMSSKPVEGRVPLLNCKYQCMKMQPGKAKQGGRPKKARHYLQREFDSSDEEQVQAAALDFSFPLPKSR